MRISNKKPLKNGFFCYFCRKLLFTMRKHILLIWAICAATGLFAQDFNLPCGNINYKPEVQTVLLYADDNQLNDPIVPLSDMLGG